MGSCAKEKLLSVRLKNHSGHCLKISKYEPAEPISVILKKKTEGNEIISKKNKTTERNKPSEEINTTAEKSEEHIKVLDRSSPESPSKTRAFSYAKTQVIKEEVNIPEGNCFSSRKQIKSLTMAICAKDSVPKVRLPTLGLDNKLSSSKLSLEENRGSMLSLSKVIPRANKDENSNPKEKTFSSRALGIPSLEHMGRS